MRGGVGKRQWRKTIELLRQRDHDRVGVGAAVIVDIILVGAFE